VGAALPPGVGEPPSADGSPTGEVPPPVDPAAVQAVLAREIDEAQAAMFARRLVAVEGMLGDSDADRLLRALLCGRLTELLAGPAPRALRVRALADFVYSQHARLRLGGRGPSVEDFACRAAWRPAAAGVEHATLSGGTQLGPQRIHLLRLDPLHVRLAAVDRRPEVARGEDLAAHAARIGALAAWSGGFFLYSEPDIAPPSARYDPVGLLVTEGALRSAPLFTRTALTEDATGWHVGPVELDACRLAVGGHELALRGRRRWTRAATRSVACDDGALVIVGDRVQACVAPGARVEVPLNGVVLAWPEPPVAPGSIARWSLPGVACGIAGGPRLVEAGRPLADLAAAPVPAPQLVAEDFCGTAPPRTFSQDETGDRNLLPRLAVGLDRSGRLLVAAVDGRDLSGALGLTLSATARLMAALGCVDAMNLDGGSSKRLVLLGRTLDSSTTEIVSTTGSSAAHRRPVRTAFFALPR